MAEKASPQLHFKDVLEMIARLDSESDRAVALIVTAWIDDALTEMVKCRLVNDEVRLEAFFGHSGPIGTFSSKISMAYLMRRISKTVSGNLDTIRRIRNNFAHSREDITFGSQSVHDLCKNLILPRFKQAEELEGKFDPRAAFVATGMSLIGFLIEFKWAETVSKEGEDQFPSFVGYMDQEMSNMVAKFTDS